MLQLATELIDPHEVAAHSTDALDNQTTVTRSLTLLAAEPHWSYGDGRGRSNRSGATPGPSCASSR